MAKRKVHAIGERRIGSLRTTACSTYMVDGYYKVATTKVHSEVTCQACRKALVKTEDSRA